LNNSLILFQDKGKYGLIQDGAIQGSGEGESAGDEPAKETRTATGGNRDQVMLSVVNATY